MGKYHSTIYFIFDQTIDIIFVNVSFQSVRFSVKKEIVILEGKHIKESI